MNVLAGVLIGWFCRGFWFVPVSVAWGATYSIAKVLFARGQLAMFTHVRRERLARAPRPPLASATPAALFMIGEFVTGVLTAAFAAFVVRALVWATSF